jgi:hypothetical protein
MPAPPPRHLRARPRPLSVPLRWLLLAAFTVPLLAGVGGVGERTAEAAPGSPAAVAVRFALAQLGQALPVGRRPVQLRLLRPGPDQLQGRRGPRAAGLAPAVRRREAGLAAVAPRRRPALLRPRHQRPADHLPRRDVPGRGRMVEAPTAGHRSGSPHVASRAARQGDQTGGRPARDAARPAGRTQQRRGRRPAAPGRERPMPDRRRRVRSPDPRRRHGLPAQPRPHPRRRRRERAPGASSSPTAASAAQPAASSPARRSSDGVQAAWRCRRCRGRRWGGVALHRPPGSRWSCQPPSWTAR